MSSAPSLNAAGRRVDARAVFVNLWGLMSFLMFLASLATAEYKYACALASLVLMIWVYAVGARLLDPLFEAAPGSTPGLLQGLYARLPAWLGMGCLTVLAAAPLLTGSVKKYFAFVQALTGIRI